MRAFLEAGRDGNQLWSKYITKIGMAKARGVEENSEILTLSTGFKGCAKHGYRFKGALTKTKVTRVRRNGGNVLALCDVCVHVPVSSKLRLKKSRVGDDFQQRTKS